MATIKPNVTVDESKKQITFTFEPALNLNPIVINYDALITQSILNNTYTDDTSITTTTKNNTIMDLIKIPPVQLITTFAENYYNANIKNYTDSQVINASKTAGDALLRISEFTFNEILIDFNKFICSKLKFKFASDGGGGDCLFDAFSLRLNNKGKLDKDESFKIRTEIVDYEIINIASLVDILQEFNKRNDFNTEQDKVKTNPSDDRWDIYRDDFTIWFTSYRQILKSATDSLQFIKNNANFINGVFSEMIGILEREITVTSQYQIYNSVIDEYDKQKGKDGLKIEALLSEQLVAYFEYMKTRSKWGTRAEILSFFLNNKNTFNIGTITAEQQGIGTMTQTIFLNFEDTYKKIMFLRHTGGHYELYTPENFDISFDNKGNFNNNLLGAVKNYSSITSPTTTPSSTTTPFLSTDKSNIQITDLGNGSFEADYSDDNTYQGAMVNVDVKSGIGIRQGQGKMTFQDGSEYNGSWANDSMEGQGQMTFQNNQIGYAKYDGNWSNDLMQGQGTMTFENGNENGYVEYKGYWFNGEMSGQGTMTFENDNKDGYQKYEGNWLNGTMNGAGDLTFNGKKTLRKYGAVSPIAASSTGPLATAVPLVTERASILNKVTTFLTENQKYYDSNPISNSADPLIKQRLDAIKHSCASVKTVSVMNQNTYNFYFDNAPNFTPNAANTTHITENGNPNEEIYGSYKGAFINGKMDTTGSKEKGILKFQTYNTNVYDAYVGDFKEGKMTGTGLFFVNYTLNNGTIPTQYAAIGQPNAPKYTYTVNPNPIPPIVNFVDGYPEYDGTFDNRGRKLLGIFRYPNNNIYIGPFGDKTNGILMYGYESDDSSSSNLGTGPIITGASSSSTSSSSSASSSSSTTSSSSATSSSNLGSGISSNLGTGASSSSNLGATSSSGPNLSAANTSAAVASINSNPLKQNYTVLNNNTCQHINNLKRRKQNTKGWLSVQTGDEIEINKTCDLNDSRINNFCRATLITKKINGRQKMYGDVKVGDTGNVLVSSFKPITKGGGGSKYHMKGGAGPQTQTFFFGEFNNNDNIVKGKLYFETGDVYSGSFNNGQMEDTEGTMIFANNDRFIGSFKNGKREGQGIMEFFEDIEANGNDITYKKYTGNWSDDNRNGYGKMVTVTNTTNTTNNAINTSETLIYEGEFVNDEEACLGACYDKGTGRGRKMFPNGDVYEGNFTNGKIEGIGTVKFFIADFKDGDKVEVNINGNWKPGTINKNMNTVLLDDNKTVKTVNDIKDIRRPITVAVYKSEYTGDVKGGFASSLIEPPKENNTGLDKILNWVDKTLDLNSANNYINGKGKMIYVDNNNKKVGEYTGDFVNGQKEGQGTYVNYIDDSTYEGTWLNDKRTGKGKLTDNKSRKVLYEGDWKNDKNDSKIVDPKNISKMLKINVVTNVPGYQKFKLKASMLDKNAGSQDFVYFYPLTKLNKSFIDKKPKSIWTQQFYNEGLFRSLVMDSGSYYPKSLKDAKDAGYIDSNIKTTLDYLFYTGRVLTLGGEPFVIAGYIWEPGNWNIDLKVDKEDINRQLDIRRYANNPRMQYQILKKEMENGKNLLDNFDESLLRGPNYTGESEYSQLYKQISQMDPNRIGQGIRTRTRQQDLEEEEEKEEATAPINASTSSSTTNPFASRIPGQLTPVTGAVVPFVQNNPSNPTSSTTNVTSSPKVNQFDKNKTTSLQNFFIHGNYSLLNGGEAKNNLYWYLIEPLLRVMYTTDPKMGGATNIMESITSNNYYEEKGKLVTEFKYAPTSIKTPLFDLKKYPRIVQGETSLTNYACYTGITAITSQNSTLAFFDKMFDVVSQGILTYNDDTNMNNCNISKNKKIGLNALTPLNNAELEKVKNTIKGQLSAIKGGATADEKQNAKEQIADYFLENFGFKIFILDVRKNNTNNNNNNYLFIEPLKLTSKKNTLKYMFLLEEEDDIFLLNFAYTIINKNNKLQRPCCNISIFSVPSNPQTLIPPIYMIFLLYVSKEANKTSEFFNGILPDEFLALGNALQNLTNPDLIDKLLKGSRQTVTNNSNNFYDFLEQVFGTDALNKPFPGGGGGSLIQRGGAFYNTVNSNPAATQQLEIGTSPLSYYVTVYLELEKGKVLTTSNLIKAKCDTNYNKLIYGLSKFMGKDFVLPPDYNKLPDSLLNDRRFIEDRKRNPNNQYYNPDSQYYNPNRSRSFNNNRFSNSNSRNNMPMRYSRRRGGKKSNKKSRKNKDKNN